MLPPMGFRTGLLIGGLITAVVALTVAVVVLASGGSDDNAQPAAATADSVITADAGGRACEFELSGGEVEIELNTSDLTCVEARRTFGEYRDLVESDAAAGIGHTTSLDSGWACQEYPLADYPLMARCDEGSKRFDVVGVAPSAHLTPEGAAHPGPPGKQALFRSPTGNIACEMTTVSVRCDIYDTAAKVPAKPPGTCDQGSQIWGHSFVLSTSGTKPICTGSSLIAFTDKDNGTPVLRYGKHATLGHYACFMTKKGVACGTDNEHFLFLSYERYTGI